MRIALFASSFPAVSETFISRQVTALVELGHEVDVYADSAPADSAVNDPEARSGDLVARTFYVGPTMPPDAGYWEMPVWPIWDRTWLPGAERPITNVGRVMRAVPALLRSTLASPALTLSVLDPAEYGEQARSLSALYRFAALAARRRKYDVLHAHFGPVGNTYRFAARLWSAPLLVTFHGYDFTQVPLQQGSAVYSRLFQDATTITVNSRYARTRLESIGCPPERIVQWNMGVPVEQFTFSARRAVEGGPIRLLTVARLVEKKGVEYAIRAVAAVLRDYRQLRYEIVGDGPLREHLQSLIAQLGVQDAVVLHGARDNAFVRHRMREAHIFMLASVTGSDGDQEGTPVALMEAQASGLPVIASHHSGVPEIVIDGESGWLVPERDVQTLAQRLRALLASPERWPDMGARGRRHMEQHHNLSKLNLDIVDLYQRACVERTRAHVGSVTSETP